MKFKIQLVTQIESGEDIQERGMRSNGTKSYANVYIHSIYSHFLVDFDSNL
jgi:hypothetical protein